MKHQLSESGGANGDYLMLLKFINFTSANYFMQGHISLRLFSEEASIPPIAKAMNESTVKSEDDIVQFYFRIFTIYIPLHTH